MDRLQNSVTGYFTKAHLRESLRGLWGLSPRDAIDEVDEKVANLKRPKSVSVKTALVYAGELAPIVEADGYFDAIIPVEKLLGLPANP